MEVVNLDKMSLDEKKDLIGYNNLSVKDLEKIKSEINRLLSTRAFGSENILDFGSNYKKLTLIYGIGCRDFEFLVREDGIVIGANYFENAFEYSFFIGKVDKDFRIYLIDIADKVMVRYSYYGIIETILRNIGLSNFEKKGFVVFSGPSDTEVRIDAIINKIVNMEGSRNLYDIIDDDNSINYDDDLEVTLASIYFSNSKYNKFIDRYNLIVDS